MTGTVGVVIAVLVTAPAAFIAGTVWRSHQVEVLHRKALERVARMQEASRRADHTRAREWN